MLSNRPLDHSCSFCSKSQGMTLSSQIGALQKRASYVRRLYSTLVVLVKVSDASLASSLLMSLECGYTCHRKCLEGVRVQHKYTQSHPFQFQDAAAEHLCPGFRQRTNTVVKHIRRLVSGYAAQYQAARSSFWQRKTTICDAIC